MSKKLLVHAAVFGLTGGALITGLKLIEYRWLVLTHSFEIYSALIASLFAGLGIWLGVKVARRRVEVREVPVEVTVEVPVSASDFVRDQAQVNMLGLTPRELEVLEQMAAGHSNREIAERLFLSENTIKTHISRLLDKLGAKRRTQAVHQGKALRLIP